MGKYKGASRLALRPKTTEQVSQLLAHCNRRQLAVVPQVDGTDSAHLGQQALSNALHATCSCPVSLLVFSHENWSVLFPNKTGP